jgi:ABC-type multidrug transport system ATPase subunit
VELLVGAGGAAMMVFLHIVFPYSSWTGLVLHGAEHQGIKWSYFGRKANGVSGGATFGLTFVNLLLMLILSGVFNLCFALPWGPAPLGWRGLFNKAKWRALLSKPPRKEFSGLRAEHLVKSYGGLKAVDDVSLVIAPKECVLCIGANGAGKTTLLEMLSGAKEPTSGSVIACDCDLYGDRRSWEAVASVVFQDNVLHPQLTAKEHIEHFRKMNDREDDVLGFFDSMFHMGDWLDTYSVNLSGGSKRKLCIAIALVKNPQIMVLDEPTAGVDVEARQNIWRAVASLTGLSSLINAHSVEEAEAIASRVLVMRRGRQEFIGSPGELRAEFKCGYRVTLLSEDANPEAALHCVQRVVPEAVLSPERSDLLLPADLRMGSALQALGDQRCLVHLESLESAIATMIFHEEAAANDLADDS